MNRARRVIKVAAFAIIRAASFLLIGLGLKKPGEIHGKDLLRAHDPARRKLVDNTIPVTPSDPAGCPARF
jgi:hypothetical protein